MCEFCNICNHKKEAKTVYENDKLMAFLDIDPISDGHVLIVPKYHADSITKIPMDYLEEEFRVARKIVEVFEKKYGHKGYSIMQNGGECCDFGHFHLHVFPRKSGDGFGWTYPSIGGRFTDEVAIDLKEKLDEMEE